MKIKISTNLDELKRLRKKVEEKVKSGKLDFKTGLVLTASYLYMEAKLKKEGKNENIRRTLKKPPDFVCVICGGILEHYNKVCDICYLKWY